MFALKLLMSVAVLWHTLSFAAGGVYAFLAYRALFVGGYDRAWARILRSADWQLWASGFFIIAVGMTLSSIQVYLANPKLMAKAAVVVTWFLSTSCIRLLGVRHSGEPGRLAFVTASSINVACWLYGAFLGVAKPLAYGAASLSFLMAGFMIAALAIWGLTLALESRVGRPSDAHLNFPR